MHATYGGISVPTDINILSPLLKNEHTQTKMTAWKYSIVKLTFQFEREKKKTYKQSFEKFHCIC